MNYSPKNYANAFCDAVLSAKNEAERSKRIKSFLDLVAKNRDQRKLGEIVSLAEKIIGQRTGQRKVVVESARPLSAKNEKLIKGLIKPDDFVEKKINKDLVAGVRLTINDEKQFDGSFAEKIKNMLNN